MDVLISLQPKEISAGGKNPQEIVLDIVTNIIEKR